jgi:hypothetical protein
VLAGYSLRRRRYQSASAARRLPEPGTDVWGLHQPETPRARAPGVPGGSRLRAMLTSAPKPPTRGLQRLTDAEWPRSDHAGCMLGAQLDRRAQVWD